MSLSNHAGRGRCRHFPVPLFLAVTFSLLAPACEKVPLLAPSGSSITLTAGATALPLNGTTDITAQVIEPAGTPPHTGTHVTFTTTLGAIQPSEVQTDLNGRVAVKFLSGARSGTATITAISGGATGTNGSNTVKIAIGTAAVGRITLSANPTTISSNGGVAVISANVVDFNGNPLTSVPLSFSTSAGTLASTLVNTDASGNAQTSLTTTVQATVTATVGVQAPTGGTTPTDGGTTPPAGSTTGQATATVTVNVSPIPTVSITAPSGTLTAGSPVVFTITATPGTNSTAQIRNVSITFGDGTSADLGAVSGTGLTVQHVFPDTGSSRTYTVRVTVLDTLGGTTSAATVVVVQAQPPLTISVSKTSTPSGGNTIYTFTANVTPSATTVANYLWTRDGTTTLQSGGSNQLIQPFPTGEVHTIQVTATTSTGATASSSVVVP